MRLILLVLLLISLVSFEARGQARIAVVSVEGDVSSRTELEDVSAGLVAGATAMVNLVVVDRTDLTLTDAMLLIGCSGVRGECMGELASTLETDRLVFGFVRGESPAVLELTVFDASQGRALFTVPVPLPSEERAAWVSAHVEAFLSGRGLIAVRSRGVGVAWVNGTLAGPTPVAVPVTPGAVEVSVDFVDGRRGSERVGAVDALELRAVEIVPRGRPSSIDLASAPPRQAQRGRALGWTLLGVGAASGVGAAVMGAQLGSTREAFSNTAIQRDAYALADEGERQARTANVLAGLGGGLALSGLVTLVAGRADTKDSARVDRTPGTNGGDGVRVTW